MQHEQITLERKILDSDIQDAIEIRCSECYPAMAIANAFAGTKTVSWQLLDKYSFSELIAEARQRSLPIDTWHAAVDTQNRLVMETRAYMASIS